MDPKLTLLLLVFSIPSSYLLRQFHYVNLKMTWAEAQSYCRHRYTDLATISSTEHISRLNRPTLESSAVWIGLSDDPESWRDNMGKTHTNMTNYMFIPVRLTWNQARAYCRTHYTDLPTIENSEVNHRVYSTKPYATEAWIGLYRISWAWSDKSVSLFRNWAPGEPNDSERFCAAENAEHKWHDSDCNTKLAFLCHEDPEVKKTTVMLKMQTTGDLTDPAVSALILRQLGTELESRGQTDIRLQWKVQPSLQKPQWIG
ncbi:C-type lectin domain family 17, member A-like [Lampetra planeri]